MKVWTFGEARAKIDLDLDLAEEDFVSNNEMIGYFNAALDEAESEIHKLNEDYFLSYTTITLVGAQSEYSLPDDIYAQKIRALLYKNGATRYTLTKVRGPQMFRDIMETENFATSENYRYLIVNKSTTDGYKIHLIPPSREAGAYLTLWYLRNATRIPLVGEAKEGGGSYSISDINDIEIECPEFINFILTLVKAQINAKENGGQFTTEDMALIEQQRKQMVETLTKMVEDDDSEVYQDKSHYLEHN